ncbi:MAG: hypothetical protein CR968_00245 [Flavobacteriia bacterium]|nr:MAG: hypothetical protein CR968_00245 [Flavobacteriia bacterium]
MDIYNIKHRVNWTDGMSINKNNFIDTENALVSLIERTAKNSLTPVNFGILPVYKDDVKPLDVSISLDGQDSIEVVLNSCIAITLGGSLIYITPETKELLEQSAYILKHQYTFDKEEDEWYVVVSVNPYKLIPVGASSPDEEPPRQPFTLPEYKINVLPKSAIANTEVGLSHITIGKIILVDDMPQLYENFVPPCTSVQSHEDLKFAYTELGYFFNQMESFCMHIIQKIHQKRQTNDLAHMVQHLCEKTMNYLNTSIAEFRLVDKHESPVVMITKQVNLARTIKSGIDVYVGTGKEILLNYLTDWCDLNQGAFENVLIDMIDVNYLHNDINSALEKTASFTKLMLSLFKKLNELDYIGKKNDSGIFVKEEVVETNKDVKSRRSFLFD